MTAQKTHTSKFNCKPISLVSWVDLIPILEQTQAELKLKPDDMASLAQKLWVGPLCDKINEMQKKTHAVLAESMGLMARGNTLLHNLIIKIARESITPGSFRELYWGCAFTSWESQNRRWGSGGNICNYVFGKKGMEVWDQLEG